ncbi:MAG: zeta toxin family protein [Planctomycetes bacterium]|nr:zeta toxin family protein [Planctomycetota bacterium]MBU1517496.1 zeta toxin family protein [Planctomycetota bacterium]MBU2457009.1 zeta toxin family protein [Planctomycetota bacterium]MBU2597336.1 zeta toxin family protein [Planctomycetota bacterium]
MKDNKGIYIIAGPNGAGKTTFAREFLPNYAHCPNFINSDLIAQGLAPFWPEKANIKAGKLVLEQIHEYAKQQIDFAFETTLAGKTYFRMLRKFKENGYKLHLFFLWIPDTKLAIARINSRVAKGGHNVPVQDVKRRFKRSIYNLFNLYMPILDFWILFNNTSIQPLPIAKGINQQVIIFNQVLFEKIKQSAEGKL